jgi:ABC-type multidrug transport system ATPase subunit
MPYALPEKDRRMAVQEGIWGSLIYFHGLDGVDLSVDVGESVALLSFNGSGKPTLLKPHLARHGSDSGAFAPTANCRADRSGCRVNPD